MAKKDTQKRMPAKRKRSPTIVHERTYWWNRIGLSAAAVKNRPFRKLYPFEPHHADVNGHNMHYVDEGEGEPVVMVHGNPTWSFFYRTLVEGLSNRHRCLALDHIGCGFSDKPQKYQYTLETHIDNLERWLDIVLPPADWNHGKFDLVVHDWGGPIGLGYAVRHPDRVNRVVIMNTSAFLFGDMPKRIKICRTPILGDILVRGLNLFAVLATSQTTLRRLSPTEKKAYVLPYNSWKNRIALLRFVQDIPLSKGTPTHRVLEDIALKLPDALADKPILIQWGMEDWCFTPKFLEQWRYNFPKAQVDEYKAGHYLLEDAGDAILKRIKEFLEQPMYKPPGESVHDPMYDSLDIPEDPAAAIREAVQAAAAQRDAKEEEGE